ncbi:MAG: hydroxyacid dehydrogenase [Verrucomicrobiota bacterium JB024]|nr:hydroxyacid dehydrogenase [Verrucomicrobiota bacterium JB024]
MKKPRSIFLLKDYAFEELYSPSTVAEIARLTENDGRIHPAEDILAHPDDYRDVEIIFSGWGAPVMDAKLLSALPSLKAFLYGAGSVRSLVSEEFWARGIRLTSAYTGNAIPVAEYTVACVVLSLKRAWAKSQEMRAHIHTRNNIPGVYAGSKVGIISLGAIGRLVCQRLSAFTLDVVAYDPFAGDAVFEELSVRRAPTLESLFAECDIVSLHAPSLPETKGMITGELLELMPPNASFINTSRGAIVDEPALIRVLNTRPDLFAVLDVIEDESTASSSPLMTMPNVFLTPHIAGSAGRECHRLGDMALEECRRYLAGEPAVVPVTEQNILRMA